MPETILLLLVIALFLFQKVVQLSIIFCIVLSVTVLLIASLIEVERIVSWVCNGIKRLRRK